MAQEKSDKTKSRSQGQKQKYENGFFMKIRVIKISAGETN
jgi:hypothetical protein